MPLNSTANTSPRRDDEMTLVFPGGVLGLFILAWGFLSSHLAISIGLCLLAEGIKLQRFRWDLSAKHFQNIADFTTVLFAVVVVYQFVQYGFHGIYGILGLLPLCLFPLVFAQRLSSAELFPMSALFLSLRKKIARGATTEQWVSTELIYALTCLLGASTDAPSGNYYFYIVLASSALLLFLVRSPTTQLKAWLLAMLVVGGVAVSVRMGMESGYRQIETSMSYWFSQFNWGSTNPNRARTSIGQIGRLKLSDRIVLRIKAPLSIPLPLYLHEASYTKFNLGSWHASNHQASAIDRLPSTSVYPLTTTRVSGARRIEITAKHNQDVSVQAFPIGSVGVESTEIIELKKNSLGTISLEAIPGQLRYEVDYRPDDQQAIDQLRALPAQEDLEVSTDYSKTFQQIVNELALSELSPKAATTKVQKYFAENFRYSLIGKGYYPGRKPLLSFLTEQPSGHCEYFATATTLLLRSAGIPARYSVGYVVDEYSSLEKAFVARARHAHAWTEAYLDGHWQVVDTTPANWLALEQDRISNWQAVQDYLAWAGLHLNRLQRLDRTSFNKQIIWLVPALLMLLMWRLRREITVKASAKQGEIVPHSSMPSTDMARLVDVLIGQGFVPAGGQTLSQFLISRCPVEESSMSLEELVSLYYRERFSGVSISAGEKMALRDGIKIYIDALQRPS